MTDMSPIRIDRGRVRRTDPDTSRQASRDNLPRTPKQRSIIQSVLCQREDGMTQDEMESELIKIGKPMKISSIAKRMGELIADGLAHVAKDYSAPLGPVPGKTLFGPPILTRRSGPGASRQRVVRWGRDRRAE